MSRRKQLGRASVWRRDHATASSHIARSDREPAATLSSFGFLTLNAGPRGSPASRPSRRSRRCRLALATTPTRCIFQQHALSSLPASMFHTWRTRQLPGITRPQPLHPWCRRAARPHHIWQPNPRELRECNDIWNDAVPARPTATQSITVKQPARAQQAIGPDVLIVLGPPPTL